MYFLGKKKDFFFKYVLFGSHVQHKSMVLVGESTSFRGRKLKLKPNLTCKSFGIYAALFTRCIYNCVGQTKINFSNRWTSNRSNWNKLKLQFNKEDIILE